MCAYDFWFQKDSPFVGTDDGVAVVGKFPNVVVAAKWNRSTLKSRKVYIVFYNQRIKDSVLKDTVRLRWSLSIVLHISEAM